MCQISWIPAAYPCASTVADIRFQPGKQALPLSGTLALGVRLPGLEAKDSIVDLIIIEVVPAARIDVIGVLGHNILHAPVLLFRVDGAELVGAGLGLIDLSNLQEALADVLDEGAYVNTTSFDINGNMYVSCDSKIYALDEQLKVRFALEGEKATSAGMSALRATTTSSTAMSPAPTPLFIPAT